MNVIRWLLKNLKIKPRTFEMGLPEAVLVSKLLEGSGLDQKDRELVVKGVDYQKIADSLKQMVNALKSFLGKIPFPKRQYLRALSKLNLHMMLKVLKKQILGGLIQRI